MYKKPDSAEKFRERMFKIMEESLKKWGIYGALLIIAIFVISFGIGFFSADEEVEKEPVLNPVNYEPDATQTVAVQIEEVPVSYYLINEEEGILRMYYVEGENITELKAEEISVEVFPQDDLLMLSEGIKADTNEEALEVWESFIS